MNRESQLFFDLDGPILDVSERYYQVYSDLVKNRGGQPIAKSDYWSHKRRRVPDESILELSGIGGWTDDYQRLRKARIETPTYLRYDTPWPGVLHILNDLKSRNSLVLVTLRHSRQSLYWELKALRILPLFDPILSAPTNDATAHRGEIKAALIRDALGTEALSGWMVGDTETDIRTGQILGLRTAAVTFGIRTVEHIAPLKPDILIHNLDEFGEWARAEG